MKLQAIIAAAILSSGCSGPLFCKASTVGQYQTNGFYLKECKEFTSGSDKRYMFVSIRTGSRCVELSDDNRSYRLIKCPEQKSHNGSNIDKAGPNDHRGSREKPSRSYDGWRGR